MLFAAGFCLLTSLSRTEDVHVSLTKTASVVAILKDLSAQSQVPLTTNEKRGKEILIVDFKDVPLNEVLDRIGWATYGAWNPSQGGYKLVQDRDSETKAERYYRTWQAKEAAQAIAQFRERVLQRNLSPEQPSQSQDTQDLRAIRLPTKLEKVLAQVLGSIRPETIIYMKPNAMAVYSDRPTPAQLAFTSDVTKVMEDYNEAGGTPVKHILLTCSYAFEELNAKVSLYDSKGGYFVSTSARIRLYPTGKRPSELADEIPEDMAVPLSEASKFFVRPIDTGYSWPSNDLFQKAPDIVERLRNPEKYEPLASIVTDSWRAVAKWKHRNLVANVDDAYMTPVWGSKVPSLREAFRNAGGYNAELKTDWLLARPSLPSPPWQHRLDRSALGKLVRMNIVNGVDMFKAIGDFSASQTIPPDPYSTSQYLAWAGCFNLIDLRQWPSARLYGSLTSEQQRRFLEGGNVDLSKTSRIAKEVTASFFTPSDYDNVDLWQQTTVRFPTGLAENGLLSGTQYDNSQLYVLRPGADGKDVWIGGYDFSDAHWYMNNILKNEPDMLKRLKIMYIPSAGINVSAQLPSDAGPANVINVYMMSPPTYRGPMLWGDLPKWMKDRIMNAPLPSRP